MKRTLILPLTLLILSMTACGHHLTNTPNATSEIVITTADPNPQPVSAPGSKASINMTVGQHRIFQIMRTVTDQGHTTTTNQTANSDFNFTDPAVAAMDASGQLTALSAGFTTLEVVYRDGDGDPTDDDKVAMDITVTP